MMHNTLDQRRFKTRLHLIKDSIPTYVKEDIPELQDFLSYYVKWSESIIDEKYGLLARLNSFDDLYDVGRSYDDVSMKELHRNQFMNLWPTDTKSSYKILLQTIGDAYRSKSTEDSVRHMFRVLYDADIKIKYPLKYNDVSTQNSGRKVKVIRFRPIGGVSPEYYSGKTIVGQTTNTVAYVDFCQELIYGTIPNQTIIYQATLSKDSALTFDINETFLIQDDTIGGTVSGVVSRYKIIQSGRGVEGALLHTKSNLDQQSDGSNPHSGSNFRSRIEKVRGYVFSHRTSSFGEGYTDDVTITVVGDGQDAVVQPVLDNGRIVDIMVLNPGSNYTKASFNIEGTNTRPALIEPILYGDILDVGFMDCGYDYIDNGSFDPPEYDFSVGSDTRSSVKNKPKGTYSIPIEGAQIDLSVNSFSILVDVPPNRLSGNFTPQETTNLPKFDMYFHLDRGSYNFAIGDVVTQTRDGILIFSGLVKSWNPENRELILSQDNNTADVNIPSYFSNLRFYDRSIPLVSGSNSASISNKYHLPFYIDRGDNRVNDEFTYMIFSDVSAREYRTLLKTLVHPAGHNAISVFDVGVLFASLAQNRDAFIYHILYPIITERRGYEHFNERFTGYDNTTSSEFKTNRFLLSQNAPLGNIKRGYSYTTIKPKSVLVGTSGIENVSKIYITAPARRRSDIASEQNTAISDVSDIRFSERLAVGHGVSGFIVYVILESQQPPGLFVPDPDPRNT